VPDFIAPMIAKSNFMRLASPRRSTLAKAAQESLVAGARQKNIEMGRAQFCPQAKPERQIHFRPTGVRDISQVENVVALPAKVLRDEISDPGFRGRIITADKQIVIARRDGRITMTSQFTVLSALTTRDSGNSR
jgi:hypothetical protein